MKYKYSDRYMYCCSYTFLFCTKYKKEILTKEIRDDLYSYINQYFCNEDYNLKELTINSNNILLTVEAPVRLSPEDIVISLKRKTARYIKDNYDFVNRTVPSVWTKKALISTDESIPEEIIKEFINKQTTRQQERKK